MKHTLSSYPIRGLCGAAVALASLTFAGCTTTGPGPHQTAAEQRSAINESADKTLSRLYETASNSRALEKRAKGVLIFPNVASVGFVLGVEHGDGVLRVNGQNQGYYTTTGGSVGWQAGAQSRAVVLLFMTQAALDKFLNSSGWTAGVDATVAVAKVGANGKVDTNTGHRDVVGFVMTNEGLMAGVSLDGAKIKKKDL